MLAVETVGKVPKTIRRHIKRCTFCREKLIALQTQMVTGVDETIAQRPESLITENERVKSRPSFVRIKTKILAILLPSKKKS